MGNPEGRLLAQVSDRLVSRRRMFARLDIPGALGLSPLDSETAILSTVRTDVRRDIRRYRDRLHDPLSYEQTDQLAYRETSRRLDLNRDAVRQLNELIGVHKVHYWADSSRPNDVERAADELMESLQATELPFFRRSARRRVREIASPIRARIQA